MDEIALFAKVCGPTHTVLDVIFVHGLTGDPVQTWTTSDNDFWPKWLCQTFGEIGIYTMGYPCSIYERWAKKEMDLHERANHMLEKLASYDMGNRPIILVTHSLGGLLAKEMLRTSKECTDEDWQKFAQSTKLVAFLATPHTGATLASVIKFVAPRLASSFIDLLTNDSGYLTNLNQSYRDLALNNSIATVAYYEKFKTKDVALVVSSQSADPGAGKTRPVAVDADHISICKPSDRDSFVFTSLCRHIRRALKDCVPPNGTPSFGTDDYGAKSHSDRRDLLQKLIDAGREHEYPRANDLQNKFAQRYTRLGLFTDAKDRSDALLASVEQRFTMHVYSAKICKNASDDEIATAIQVKVIDPLCSNGNGISATAVLQALYFLTGQCYIQWDAR